MRCPFCQAEKDSLKVIDSRSCEGGRSIRRRRECLNCSKRFTTYERIEQTIRLMVVKKDGRRVPWDRARIRSGLERACFKRPIPQGELERIAEEIEEEVFAAYDRDVPTAMIGTMVTDRLRRLDQVAYVRFASVYRNFRTVEDLVEAAKSLRDAHYLDDPSQGELFRELPAGPNGREFPTPVQAAPKPGRPQKVPAVGDGAAAAPDLAPE